MRESIVFLVIFISTNLYATNSSVESENARDILNSLVVYEHEMPDLDWRESNREKFKKSNLTVSIVGDSISDGAFVENVYNESWIGIVRDLILKDKNATNLGFLPVSSRVRRDNPDNNYTIRKVNNLRSTLGHYAHARGGWKRVYKEDNISVALNEYSFGVEYNSSREQSITFTPNIYSKDIKFVKISYVTTKEKNSMFDIYINNKRVYTYRTSSRDKENLFTKAIKIPKSKKTPKIKVVVTSGYVEIAGIEYFTNIDSAVVNVFANSGRKTKTMTLKSVESLCQQSDIVIWALGHNDNNISLDRGSPYYNVISKLVEESKREKTSILIADFSWFHKQDAKRRQWLKRIAQENSHIAYIPFPDILRRASNGEKFDGEFIQKRLNWSDNAHPRKEGHAWIASLVAKALNLRDSFNVEYRSLPLCQKGFIGAKGNVSMGCNNNVLKLIGANWRNYSFIGYINKREGSWQNREDKVVLFDMLMEAKSEIVINITTTEGSRYLHYTLENSDRGNRRNHMGIEKHIYFGLGNVSDARHTIIRDLENDLKRYQPNNRLLAVNGMFFKGSFSINKIALGKRYKR